MSEPGIRQVKVWDGWIRLFHWAIVLLLAAQWLTAKLALMEWHFRFGFTVLALLLFRLAWGIIGSDTARFARFLKSPLAALRHLEHLHRREPDTEIGHNAAGGWMVLVMLALLLGQVATGLFANEEPGESYSAHGPFALRVSGDLSHALTGWHEALFNLILLAVALHVAAVLAYALLKRHDLVRPMITGFKRLPAGLRAPRMASPALAALLLAGAAVAARAISRLGD
jgi:cytochrome b